MTTVLTVLVLAVLALFALGLSGVGLYLVRRRGFTARARMRP